MCVSSKRAIYPSILSLKRSGFGLRYWKMKDIMGIRMQWKHLINFPQKQKTSYKSQCSGWKATDLWERVFCLMGKGLLPHAVERKPGLANDQWGKVRVPDYSQQSHWLHWTSFLQFLPLWALNEYYWHNFPRYSIIPLWRSLLEGKGWLLYGLSPC